MKTKNRRMPAEWEPQSAVQLTWPHEGTDWAPILSEITAVYEEMKREIAKREPVIIVDDIPHNDTWARDHGFITVVENSPLKTQNSKLKTQNSSSTSASTAGARSSLPDWTTKSTASCSTEA